MKNKKPGKQTSNKDKKKVAAPSVKTTSKSKVKSKPRAKISLPVEPAAIVKSSDAAPTRCVPILIRTKFYSKMQETAQTLQVPLVDKDTIRLDLTINLRMSEAILIEPIRRDLRDVKGLISDAESIANEKR